ncbi:MAG: HAMP domain-containing protein, partial [Elusimicrobiota bacterium]
MKYNLRTVFSLIVIGVVIAVTGISTYFRIQREKQVLIDQIKTRGESQVNSIATLALDPLLVYDYTPSEKLKLNIIAEDFSTLKGVVYAIIFDREGNPVTDILDRDNSIVKSIKQEDDIHKVKQIYNKLKKREDIMHFEKVMRVGEQIVGYSRIGLSSQIVQKTVNKAILTSGLIGLGTVIALISIIILIFQFFVNKPITQMTRVTSAIANGNLNKRVDIKSKNEIGFLAESLNKMADSLQQIQKELIKKEKLSVIGELASGVGHELRTPLASIKNTAYYLEKYAHIDDPEVKEYINTLSSEVKIAEEIISDLLDFSRTTQIEKEKTSLRKVIQETKETLRLSENIEIETEIEEKSNEIIADQVKIRQVFINLIKNSSQAMPDGGRIKIRTSNIDENKVKIEYSDTGKGMDEETLKHVFEPLFTTKAKGIG